MNKNFLDRLYNYRSFMPWYDSSADYNTDAKSYYDYLARTNKLMDVLTDLINDLIKRKISFNDSNTIDFDKNDPINEIDDINVTADVLLAKNGINYDNAIQSQPDGLYAKDFSNDVARLFNIIDTAGNAGVDYRDIGVMAYLPYKFKFYDSWIASSGQSYYAPGGLFIDDDYYYILHNPQSFTVGGDIKNASNIVAIYNKENFDTVAVFAVGGGTAESIYVEKSGNNRYLYIKADTKTWELGKYDISTFTTSAIVSPKLLKKFDIKLHMEFSRFGNKWITEQVTVPRGKYSDRTMLAVWDDEFNNKDAQFYLNPTTSFYNRPLYNDHKAVKRQGFVVQNGQIIQVTGGLWRYNEPVTNYHMVGTQKISPNGDVSDDNTFSPKIVADYLISQGKTVDRIESEWATLFNNKVHTIFTYRTGEENTDGIALVQFESPRRDFRGEGTNLDTELVNSGYNGRSPYLPINRDEHLFNPFTGEDILDLRSLMQFMIETALDEVKFFTSAVKDMKDVDGITPLDGSSLITVKNTNQSLFWVNFENYFDWYNKVVILDSDFKVKTDQIRTHLPNTPWVSVPLANGVTGAIDVRLAGYTMEIRLTGVRGLAKGKTLATLPSGYLPFAGNSWHTTVISDSTVATLNVQDDGDIILSAVVGELPSDGGSIWATLIQTTYIQPK